MLIKQATFFTLNLLGFISFTQAISACNQRDGEFQDRTQWQVFLQNELDQQRAQAELRRRVELQQTVRVQKLDEYPRTIDKNCCDMTVKECCIATCLPCINTCISPVVNCIMKFHNWCGRCAMDKTNEKTQTQRMM